MKTRFAMVALLAAMAARLAGPAVAQTIPEGQSCGGLLCDMGVLGTKTAPPPAPATPAVAAPPTASAPATNVAVVPESVAPGAKLRPAPKKKRIAKTVPKIVAKTTVVAAPTAPPPPAAAVRKPAAAGEAAKPVASPTAPAFDPDSQPALENFGIVPIYR